MSINDNQWPPASAGASIPTEQALAEEKAFQEKYPQRSAYYELLMDLEHLFMIRARDEGCQYYGIVNTQINATTVGYARCGIMEDGELHKISDFKKACYKDFREQTKGNETALYGFDIEYIILEFGKAADLGYDYVRFYNGINAQGQNTMNFGFRKEGSEQVDGMSGRGNNPFLCPPLCPPA